MTTMVQLNILTALNKEYDCNGTIIPIFFLCRKLTAKVLNLYSEYYCHGTNEIYLLPLSENMTVLVLMKLTYFP